MIETTEGLNRICQGDIFREIDFIEHIEVEAGIVEISTISFPLVIVLTQDCDLEQDFGNRNSEESATHDKLLLSVLVAPLYNAEHVYLGEHLEELDMKMQEISRKKTPGQYLRNNQLPRYHYLEFRDTIPIVPSVIDFKHYFSVNVEHLREVREAKFVYSMPSLFRERISQRFANYLARIGLPTQ